MIGAKLGYYLASASGFGFATSILNWANRLAQELT